MADMLKGDASRLRSALLIALDDFRQVADIFGQHTYGNLDNKSFYCTLFVRCLSLRQALNGEKNHVQIQGFMRDALKQLESLISDPLVPHKAQDDYSHTFPGLKKLHLILTTPKESHSKLKALRNCVAFGSKEKKTALLELLSKSCPVVHSETSDEILESALEIPRKTRQRPSEDVRSAANSLIRVLKAKRTCNCKPKHNCTVQLSLETHRAQLNSCNFDLYFGLERVWQEARVQTGAYLSPEISNLSMRHRDTSHGFAKGNSQKRLVDRLCKEIIKIAKFPDYRLRFSLEMDSLWKLQSEESNFVIDRSQKPTSLTELLDETTFLINDRIELILSVLLGYAVLHLYETSWLPPTWGSCNVMFFRSYDGLPMRPYLSPRLSDESATEQVDPRPPNGDEEEIDPDDLLLPPYPCLVGLAIVLMELHKAASFRSLTDSYGIQLSDETDLAARFIAARELFRRLNEDFELRDQKKMAIQACLDPKIDRDDNSEKLDDPRLQIVIYERIVRLLEDELEQSFSDVAIDNLDNLIQKLDLSNGGKPLGGTRNHDGSMHISTSILTKDLNNPEIGRKVRFHSSSMDVIAQTTETAENISLPTAGRNTYNARGSPKQQTESASQAMVQKHASIDAHKSFVAPLVARKSPSDRPDTLRVMNIPDKMSESDLSTKLEQLVGWKCHVHSLARASRDARWKKHATVTFPGLPNSTLTNTIQNLQHQIIEDHLEFDKNFLDLTPLYDGGDSAIVDIIAIEGLGTNPFGTFRAPQGDLMWLRDFLPRNFSLSRVLLYGYDSKVPGSMSNQSVREIASTCKNIVTDFRELTKTDERPIIWLGQSMGGLIVQEARLLNTYLVNEANEAQVLVQAHQHRSQRSSGNLSDHSIGFLGYGVPMKGLQNESLLNAVKKQPNFELIKSICLEGDRPSHYLKDLANRFALCKERLSIYQFYETNPSEDIWGHKADPERRVDDQEVVGHDRSYWVSRNHSELVKVPDTTDFVYTTTVRNISLILNRHIPGAYS